MENSKPGKLTVESFGYHFVKVHQGKNEVTVLRNKATGERFKFDVYKDKSKNQQRYEELGEVEAGKTEPQGFFFMSEYARYFKKLMILVHGGGAVRAGQWARSVIINENLESGTMVPYVEKALEEGYGVIITNGNHNRDSNNRPIQGSESAEEHFVYVWNNFIKDAKAKDIVIVAHSLGGEVVLHGLKNIDEAMRRIKAVAFTHSTHTTTKESVNIKAWLKERARKWVTSDKPLDTPVKIDCEDDCDQVSANTKDHTMTSHFAKDSVFNFFEEKLNAEDVSNFINPTQFNLTSPKHRPHKLEEVYRMTSNPRGLTVIVNMRHFEPYAGQEDREGSEIDTQGLMNLFKGLDFRTIVLFDHTKDELLSEFQEIRNNVAACDCLAVCIMSHGDEDYFVASDGEVIKIQTIREMFNNRNCEALCGKPKLFFINACRGESTDFGTVVKEGGSRPSKDPQVPQKQTAYTTVTGEQTTAENADVLTAFSSVEGYVSYRNTARGSRFITSLIAVFREYAGVEDVLSMLTLVNKEVNLKGGLGEKQVPKPETTLTKKVFFWPGLKFE